MVHALNSAWSSNYRLASNIWPPRPWRRHELLRLCKTTRLVWCLLVIWIFVGPSLSLTHCTYCICSGSPLSEDISNSLGIPLLIHRIWNIKGKEIRRVCISHGYLARIRSLTTCSEDVCLPESLVRSVISSGRPSTALQLAIFFSAKKLLKHVLYSSKGPLTNYW
jgi:hypothetical protein